MGDKQRKLEELLKESEEKYRNLIHNIRDILIEVDLDRKITYISPQTQLILGYKPEELLGIKYDDIIHPNEQLFSKEQFLNALTTGEFLNAEHRIRHKMGHYVSFSMRGTIINFHGEIKGIGILRDITEKQRMEQKLKESEENYRFLIANINDLLVEVDFDRIITYISPQVDQILGYRPEELIGKDCQDLVPPNENLIKRDDLVNALSKKEPIISEHQIRHKLGHYKIFSIRGNIVNKNDGIRMVGIFRDISELKKTEQQLKESEMKYREAYDREMIYRDIFIHDFNNFLQNIQSACDSRSIYKEKNLLDAHQDELFNIIEEQVFRGSKLIKNVRKLSQIEESQVLLGSVNLYQVLRNSIQFIKNSYQKKSLKITELLVPGEIYVKANELLYDVFENILINAVKYCEEQTCEITIKTSKFSENNTPYVAIEINDNGMGIPDESKPIIFQIGFNKEKRSTGMGFGLTVVKKIITLFNGTITVENRVKEDFKQGSNFILHLIEG